MVFLGIYRAVYDYVPRSSNELEIAEGDLLFVLEKSTEDDWWKAKKKAGNEDEDEPEGLIPNNYVEETTPMSKANALYDYTRQTDEELSFTEDALLDVYDTSDPDWTLVGLNGEFGFVPANYIKSSGAAPEETAPPAMPARPRAPLEPEVDEPPTPSFTGTPGQSSAVALAGILTQRTSASSANTARAPISPPPATMPPRHRQFTPEASDEEPPSLPRRPPSEQHSPRPTKPVRSPSPAGVQASLPFNRAVGQDPREGLGSPGGYHLYNIHEMIEHNGKNRKMPVTLGINIARGVIMISPEKSRDGPQKEWTAEKMTHYSIEGKHVFMELVKPSRSIDFHAGAKDTAREIVSSLGVLAGAVKAEGLKEILTGDGPTQKKGQMLYDFMAQGEDEVTVAAGDEVLIVDDQKSDEWWMVRRLKNGNEGVVPSSYVEITGSISMASPTTAVGHSHVGQNRQDEEKLTRQAMKASKREGPRGVEVGPGLELPQRMSSLALGDTEKRSSQRSKRESSRDAKGQPSGKTKPNASKVRTWTDRSGTFKVEAEFIGLREGKIHLHKLNGVKIAVPVPKMSVEDLEYVERASGVSLDDDKPLSTIKRRESQRLSGGTSKAGISVEHPKRPEYDWFDFFLHCGVNPQICERYAAAFHKDEMGEESMQDISPQLLRTLGLKEGDILRVMRHLDSKFGRPKTMLGDTGAVNGDGETADGANGGLFSGAGGALRNNTKKGRPAPASGTNDIVDAKAFSQKTDEPQRSADVVAAPLTSAPERRISTGFEDNAWEPRQVKQQPNTSPAQRSALAKPPPAAAPVQPPTGAMGDLDLLSQPLQPTPAPQPAPQVTAQQAGPTAAPQQLSQPTGATPSLFEQLATQSPGQAPHQRQIPAFVPQPTGFNQQQPQQQQQFGPPRQRPQPPQHTSIGGLVPPPPARAASVPNQPGFAPPPLQPQLTGYHPQPHLHTQMSPPGQSLQDLNQQRMQQSYLQSQPTGYGSFGLQAPSLQQQFINGQQAGSPFADPPRQFQPMQMGYQNNFQPKPMQSQPSGVNSFLPPALQPEKTGFSQFSTIPGVMPSQAQLQPNQFGNGIPPQPTGFGQFQPLQAQQTAFGQPGFQQQQQQQQQQQAPPPIPPIPQQQPTPAPLVPQKTGPAPPVRFGVNPAANKLMPQPTGRRANLQFATPQNPFGL